MNRNRRQLESERPGLQHVTSNQWQQYVERHLGRAMELGIHDAPTFGGKIVEVQHLVLALTRARREDHSRLQQLQDALNKAEQKTADLQQKYDKCQEINSVLLQAYKALALARQQARTDYAPTAADNTGLETTTTALHGGPVTGTAACGPQDPETVNGTSSRNSLSSQSTPADSYAASGEVTLQSEASAADPPVQPVIAVQELVRTMPPETATNPASGLDDTDSIITSGEGSFISDGKTSSPGQDPLPEATADITGDALGIVAAATEQGAAAAPEAVEHKVAQSLVDQLGIWHAEMTQSLDSIIRSLTAVSPLLTIDSIKGTTLRGNVLQAKVREVYAAVPAVIATLEAEDRQQLQSLVVGTGSAVSHRSKKTLSPWAAANTYVYNRCSRSRTSSGAGVDVSQLVDRIFARQGLFEGEQDMRRAVVTVLVVLLILQQL